MEYQLHIVSAHTTNTPKVFLAAPQTSHRSAAPNEANNTAFFENLDVGKYFVEIDIISYPTDSVNVEYNTNNYLNQYRDLEIFCKEYVGEPQ